MMSPLQAIHHHCAVCTDPDNKQMNNKEIAGCEHKACPLYPYRLGKLPSAGEVKKISPLRACRAFCLEECQGGTEHKVMDVKTCQGDTWAVTPCPLFSFRFGRNPNRKRKKRASQV